MFMRAKLGTGLALAISVDVYLRFYQSYMFDHANVLE